MDPDRPGQMAETHISWVLLTSDLACKIHKPIRTDFLDRSDVASRRHACREEVELNARLAPDVYRGVGAITLDGDELEPVVVMRRMPDDRRLTALLHSDAAREHVRDVARTVAAFHARAEVASAEVADDVATAAANRRRWDEDIAGVRDASNDAGIDERIDAIEVLAHRYIAGRERLFEHRIAQSMIRDGHGDLLAQDIFCLDDGPRILDCLAFDARLRTVDVLADVAFLVMDLQHLRHAELAVAFLRDYCEFSDERHPGSLAHLHVAQRALVRAKVAAIRHQQDPASGTEARTFLDQALDHLRRAELRLVLVGGIPGSGKSTVAEQLSDEYGWMVLSTDTIRRDLRVRRTDIGSRAYAHATVATVYDRMYEEAGRLLELGYSVVLDASWTSAEQRAAARRVAAQHHARTVELRCEAPRDLCRERIRRRDARTSDSEATVETVDQLADRTDPWTDALVVDTSGAVARPVRPLGATAVWLRAPAGR